LGSHPRLYDSEERSMLVAVGWHSWSAVEEALTCSEFATAKCPGIIVPGHLTGDEVKSPHC
jgi:hypothetical protein